MQPIANNSDGTLQYISVAARVRTFNLRNKINKTSTARREEDCHRNERRQPSPGAARTILFLQDPNIGDLLHKNRLSLMLRKHDDSTTQPTKTPIRASFVTTRRDQRLTQMEEGRKKRNARSVSSFDRF